MNTVYSKAPTSWVIKTLLIIALLLFLSLILDTYSIWLSLILPIGVLLFLLGLSLFPYKVLTLKDGLLQAKADIFAKRYLIPLSAISKIEIDEAADPLFFGLIKKKYLYIYFEKFRIRIEASKMRGNIR